MNYIKQLEERARILGAVRADAEAEIIRFQLFLNGPKFTGTENGERKDWISTTDVFHFLQELRQTLQAGR